MVSFWRQRADESRRRRLARVAGVDDGDAQARLRSSFDGQSDLFAGSGSGRDFRVEPVTAEEQARRRAALGDFVFGPERGSVVPFVSDASRPERVLRDWVASEQEFRLAGERAAEGRFGAAAGWGALGLAGAVPFFGDAAQALGKAARASSRAADVAVSSKVVGRDLTEELTSEFFNSGKLNHTKPSIEQVPFERRNVAELIYRQGFEAPARSVPTEEFNSMIGAGQRDFSRPRLAFEYDGLDNNIVIYRGIGNDLNGPATTYSQNLIDGNYYVGHGIYGHGMYFTREGPEALGYGAKFGAPDGVDGGALVRAILPSNAKIMDLNPSAVNAFEQSPFTDLSEFALSRGFDGARVSFYPDAIDKDYIVIFNRSILTFDQPRVISPDDAAFLFMERNITRQQYLDDLFKGTDNMERARSSRNAIVSEAEGFNF